MVAVTKGLENIKDGIAKYGYEIAMLEDCAEIIDAVIYDFKDYPGFEVPVSGSNYPLSKGIFLINSRGRTAGEIAGILKNRTYSPLILS